MIGTMKDTNAYEEAEFIDDIVLIHSEFFS